MFLARLLVATVLATSAAVASSDEIQIAYDAGHYAEALTMLERRGLEGDVEAQGMAGMMHLMGSRLYGDQVPTDPERAARWVRAAALNDSLEAMFILAQLYQQGIGVPLDGDRANRWLTQLTANSFVYTIAQAAER